MHLCLVIIIIEHCSLNDQWLATTCASSSVGVVKQSLELFSIALLCNSGFGSCDFNFEMCFAG